MREHERRELLLIEQHLLAQAPELIELFGTQPSRRRRDPGRRTLHVLAAVLALLGVFLSELPLLLAALALVAMSVVYWTVYSEEAVQPDRQRR